MRFFLALAFTEVAATLLRLLAARIRPGFMTDASLQNSVDPLGNLIFVLLLACLIWRHREIKLVAAETLGAVAAFFAVVIALVFVGILIHDRTGFGLQTVALIGTIGYYPAGADVPIDYGLPVWFVSSLVTILLGFALGAALRRFGPKRGSTGNLV